MHKKSLATSSSYRLKKFISKLLTVAGTLLVFVIIFQDSLLAEDSDSGVSVLNGTVVRVIDGDSLLVKGEDGVEQQVHLEGIDAPEVKQESGGQATKVLESLVKGKSIEIKWKKKDDFQRILGQVYQESVHVNLKMIEKGYAWHYARYFKSEEFADAEKKAKSSKLGLWDESSPTPPWDYRKANRNAEK